MKHNNSWKRYLCLVFCLFLMCITFGCGPEKKEKSHTETSEIVTEINNDEDEEIEKSINNDNEEESLQTDFSNALEFHFLDVEQGTSILVNCDDHWLLYDGGNSGTSSYVVAYLKKQGIKKLDYIIASHFDADHISGFSYNSILHLMLFKNLYFQKKAGGFIGHQLINRYFIIPCIVLTV